VGAKTLQEKQGLNKSKTFENQKSKNKNRESKTTKSKAKTEDYFLVFGFMNF